MERLHTKGKTKEDLKLYMTSYMQCRREKFREQGLCTICGKPTVKGKSLCESCREKRNAAQKRYNERKKKSSV